MCAALWLRREDHSNQGPKRQPGTGGVAPAGTKILSAFGFQDFIAFFCPGSILRERGTTQRHTGASLTDTAAGPSPPRLPGPSGSLTPRRIAHGPTRGRAEAWNRPRNQWRAKPEPPCTACRLRGVQGPPWSIFGHFLLIKKVATWASDVCLTISQTTNTSHGTR